MTTLNTSPIFVGSIFKFKATLTNQAVSRDLTTGNPVLLGTAGPKGSMIHGIDAIPLGDNNVSTLRIFTQKASGSQTDKFFEFEVTLPAISGSNNTSKVNKVTITLPEILPTGNRALHLDAAESIYCGLGTIVNTGWNVFVRGGDY